MKKKEKSRAKKNAKTGRLSKKEKASGKVASERKKNLKTVQACPLSVPEVLDEGSVTKSL